MAVESKVEPGTKPKVKRKSALSIPPKAERPRIVQALHSEHIYMANLLNTLEEQVDDMAAGKKADINLILDIVHYMKNFPDHFHHPREDIVYEILAEREKSIKALLLDLRGEHGELEALAEEVVDCMEDVRLLPTALKKQHAKEVCADYTAMLRHHMDQEEAGVLPIASRVLTELDWEDIERKTARYEELPTTVQVGDQIDEFKRKVNRRVEKTKDDILLAEFLSTTAVMETAGAMAKGVADITSALNKAGSASWTSYTNAWKTLIPGNDNQEPVKDQWVDSWETFSSGVKQVTTASGLMRDESILPSRNGLKLFKAVVSKRK